MFEAEITNAFENALAETGIRGASLGVSYPGGRICLSAGVADQVETPVNARSLFSVGSIAKLWTSQIICELVESNQLELHAPIKDVLPDFNLSDASAAAEISAFHLLTHTSGIDGDYIATPRPENPAEYLASLAGAPQLHQPGEMFSYCNAGFVVLGEAYSRLTGQTWRQGVTQVVLEKCGAQIKLLSKDAEDCPRVRGWRRDALGAFTVPVAREVGSDALAAWGDVSRATSDALLRYAEATLGIRPGFDLHILAKMWRRQVSGPRVGDGWGLGFRRWRLGDLLCVGHDGGVPGETSYLRIVPDRGLALTLLTNGEDSSALFNAVFTRACQLSAIEPPMAENLSPRPANPPITALTGLYRRHGAEIEIYQSGNSLAGERRISDPMGGLPSRFALEAIGAIAFRTVPQFGEGGQIEFVTRSSGEVFLSTGLRLYPRSEPSC